MDNHIKKSSYFEDESKFDRRYYFNTWKNIFQVIALLLSFYGLHVLIFWAHVSLGSTHPEEAQWLNVAFFILANVWIFFMLVIGSFVNKKLRKYQFFMEKINDKEQEIREAHQRAEQKKKQEEKLAAQKFSSWAWAESKWAYRYSDLSLKL